MAPVAAKPVVHNHAHYHDDADAHVDEENLGIGMAVASRKSVVSKTTTVTATAAPRPRGETTVVDVVPRREYMFLETRLKIVERERDELAARLEECESKLARFATKKARTPMRVVNVEFA